MAGHTPLDSDRAHLLHPLHHPSAYAKARVWVSGEGAMIKDSTGREYIDGLSGLWNVNVGHGRKELGEAARTQMGTLAFTSAYAGGTNERAIELAEKLSALVYPSINTFFFTSGGAEASETSFKTARFYWKARRQARQVQGDLAHARVSRPHAGGDERHRPAGVLADVRAAHARLLAYRCAGSVSLRAHRYRASASALRRPTNSKRRSCAKAPTPWRHSSPSRCRARAA